MNKALAEKLPALKDKFAAIFGGANDEIRVFTAPGRVNLIGEHIDYNGGFVFPAALEMINAVLVRQREDNLLRLAADDLPGALVQCAADGLDAHRGKAWGSYQLGVADELIKAGYHVPGCDMLFWGNVPFGSGLSSSASIEVATAAALATLGLEASGKPAKLDGVELALIGQRAENNFVGVSCGIMDQFASAMGKENHAILLDCATLEYNHVPLSLGAYSIIIGDTRKKRSLAESKYNERRAECGEALAALRAAIPSLSALCELSPERFEELAGLIKNEAAAKRARHAVYENARVLRSVELLKAGDLEGFGELLNLSHASLCDLYEVTGPELDAMASLSASFPGCLGSRMTGAGFGGCTVSIVETSRASAFTDEVGRAYEKATGLTPAFYVSGVGGGFREEL